MDSNELSQEIQAQIALARERAIVASLIEPKAESAFYDRDTGRIVIHLRHGAIFSFPAELGQGLTGASPEHLAQIAITPSGTGLHWENLDADLSVPALLAGIYGNSEWMAQILNLETLNQSS